VDVKQIQEMFRAEDSADADTVRQFLHPDLVVNLIGVEEADSPLSRDGFLSFLEHVVADRASRGERIEHIPSIVKIEGDFVAIRGLLRTCYPGEPDQFVPYMDILKLRDGRIAEYNIAFGI
jgi:ketosteroid isomerase-like protein